MIPYSHIQVNCQAKDWKQAIEITAQPLVDYHEIEKEYIDYMIENVYTFGPYLIIAPHFALVHGSPGLYIHENALSIATFQNEIYLYQAKESVRIMMCVACLSQMSYIRTLGAIANVLMEENMIDKILACQSRREAYALICNENK